MILQASTMIGMPRIGTTPRWRAKSRPTAARDAAAQRGSSCASHHGILCGGPHFRLCCTYGGPMIENPSPAVPIGTAVGSGDFKATSDPGEANNVRGR